MGFLGRGGSLGGLRARMTGARRSRISTLGSGVLGRSRRVIVEGNNFLLYGERLVTAGRGLDGLWLLSLVQVSVVGDLGMVRMGSWMSGLSRKGCGEYSR